MITLNEIRREAARLELDMPVVERDYAISWVLKALYAESKLSEWLAFKGGTALRKAYFPHYRFSADLDFTLREPIDHVTLQERLGTAIAPITDWSGMETHLADFRTTREIPGQQSFEARVSFIGPRGQRQDPPRIRLDMTAWDEVLLPPETKSLIHRYSDSCEAALVVLSLAEILAEKLRAILQRDRPRDLYDVWWLLTRSSEMATASLPDLFERKCAFKRVTFRGPHDFFEAERLESHRRAWGASLRRLVRPVPEFDQVVSDLRGLLSDVLGD